MHYENSNASPRTVQKNPRLSAESLAELCLGQLAEDPRQLAEFMTVTGYSPAALRSAAGSDQLGRGLIDYFASNEPLLLTLCANNRLKPEEFMRVWGRLNPAG
ncbi:MAG: DUF3572 family protein [Devosia sp.]